MTTTRESFTLDMPVYWANLFEYGSDASMTPEEIEKARTFVDAAVKSQQYGVVRSYGIHAPSSEKYDYTSFEGVFTLTMPYTILCEIGA